MISIALAEARDPPVTALYRTYWDRAPKHSRQLGAPAGGEARTKKARQRRLARSFDTLPLLRDNISVGTFSHPPS